jgi:hypothetical protein
MAWRQRHHRHQQRKQRAKIMAKAACWRRAAWQRTQTKIKPENNHQWRKYGEKAAKKQLSGASIESGSISAKSSVAWRRISVGVAMKWRREMAWRRRHRRGAK